MADLAQQIFDFPSCAGEYQHLLTTTFSEWAERYLVAGYGLPLSDYQERLSGWSQRASALGAALRAERRWRTLQAQSQIRASLWRSFEFQGDGHLFSSDHISVEVQASSTWSGRARRYVPPRSFLCEAELEQQADLNADLAYWRHTADELWRLLSTPVELTPDLVDVVVLDSSPCGIRRLTAVRVPRAPGSGRTTPIPSSSLLAAA
ncbi:hypothetical protein [Streptomyces anulatus]|uniref:hypothetical protein n=1 Tax=Streptomyces anulatus TaxID=1892 RepID=UPI00131EDA62|nr:hypothetical protein [Streptomyces anulatus]